MWALLPALGWFSIVAAPDGEHLVVRARVRSDLDRLRQSNFALGPTLSGVGTDYRHRATIKRAAFADGLAALAMEIDYTNVKSEVMRTLGPEREHVMHEVWAVLLRGLRDDPATRNLPVVPDLSNEPQRRVRRRRPRR